MSDDRKHPEQDPAEGSRETIDRELKRQKGRGDGGSEAEIGRNREKMARQVKDETELPQKGSA